MTRKVDLPPEDHVRTVMAGMLADAAAGGPRPTVLALARTLGLANATFWRHYHDIATELRHHDAGARQSVPAPDQNQCPGQAGGWPARTPHCAANATTSPASSKPPSATCGGSPSTTPNCAANSKQPARSPASAGRTQPATADCLQRQAYWRFGVAGGVGG